MPAHSKSQREHTPIKPTTRTAIDRGFGLPKRKSGDGPLADEWAAHKHETMAEEKAREVRGADGSRRHWRRRHRRARKGTARRTQGRPAR